jgi:hypothetical protein
VVLAILPLFPLPVKYRQSQQVCCEYSGTMEEITNAIMKRNPMITVRVVSTLIKDGHRYESVPKSYLFDTEAQAEAFVAKVELLEQNRDAGNFINAYVVSETAYLAEDTEPLLLNLVHLSDPEEGKRREVEYHSVELYTLAEIEDFRNTGKHPAIVYAYDHQNCIKPAVPTEEEFDEAADGGNYYFGDRGEEFFLSFNPDIINLLKAEYCS